MPRIVSTCFDTTTYKAHSDMSKNFIDMTSKVIETPL